MHAATHIRSSHIQESEFPLKSDNENSGFSGPNIANNRHLLLHLRPPDMNMIQKLDTVKLHAIDKNY